MGTPEKSKVSTAKKDESSSEEDSSSDDDDEPSKGETEKVKSPPKKSHKKEKQIPVAQKVPRMKIVKKTTKAIPKDRLQRKNLKLVKIQLYLIINGSL